MDFIMDAGTIGQLVKDVGTVFVIFLLVTRLIGKNADVNLQISRENGTRYEAWGKERKAETEAWMELVTRHRRVLETITTSVDGLRQNIDADKVGAMAYQTTMANASKELLVLSKQVHEQVGSVVVSVAKLETVPVVMDEIKTAQNAHNADEGRHSDEIQTKLDAMQSEVQKMAKAMDGLPEAMRDFLEPLVQRMERALALAQNGRSNHDDYLPLVENSLVETDLLEADGNAPHPLTPSPLYGEGE